LRFCVQVSRSSCLYNMQVNIITGAQLCAAGWRCHSQRRHCRHRVCGRRLALRVSALQGGTTKIALPPFLIAPSHNFWLLSWFCLTSPPFSHLYSHAYTHTHNIQATTTYNQFRTRAHTYTTPSLSRTHARTHART